MGDESAEVTLAITGPLTLSEVPRWRDAWLAVGASARVVTVDLADAGPWDLAGLQLILAGLASARRGGASVRLVRVPEVCLAIAEQAGVAEVLARNVEGPAD